MGENAFFSYDVDKLKKYENIKAIECRGAVVARINVADVDDEVMSNILNYPCRINAYIALVCMRGEISFSSYMTKHRLTENSLYLSSATIIQFHEVHDCELYVMAFDDRFISDMNMDIRLVMPILASLRNNPVVKVPQEQVPRFPLVFENYYSEFRATPSTSVFKELIIRHIFCTLVYRICDAVSYMTSHSASAQLGVKNRSAEYFERLIRLLADNFRTQRNVKFYADRMHLTPKHLSRVIHNFTGKSVHQWIDDFVVLEIKNLLKFSDMSIQQISYELNFPNPSFMGQYFKRITGMTPGEYKRAR